MSKILIIYTGGTIGGEDLGQGWQPMNPKRFKELLLEFKKEYLHIKSDIDFKSADRTIDSTNGMMSDHNDHAKIIDDNYHDYDAFILLIGTDTADYIAVAYNEILANLDKPVLPLGSKIPLAEKNSDAHDTLLTALIAAEDPHMTGVGYVFGHNIFSPIHLVKMSTERKDMFETPNVLAVATRKDNELSINWQPSKPISPYQYKPLNENYLPVIHFSAGNNDPFDQINFDKNPSAVLMFGHGNGNIPETGRTQEFFSKCDEKDISIFIRARVPDGNANNEYEAGTWYLNENVVKLGRMTEASSVMALQRHLTDGLRGEELRQAMRERVASYIPR